MNPMDIVNRRIDAQLQSVRDAVTQSRFLAIEKMLILAAGYATPAAAVIGFLIGVVIAIKVDSLAAFAGTFVWAGALVFCHYVGNKARLLCLTTIRNNPSSISNQALLDISAFTCLTSSVGVLAFGAYLGIKESSLTVVVLCLCGAVSLGYLMWLLLQPQLISVTVEPSSSAGMDGISNIVLVYKMYLRMVTVLFGVLPTVGAALLVHSLLKSFGQPEEVIYGGLAGAAGFALVIGGLLAPLFIYLSFVASYLFFDVLRAILVMGRLASQVQRNQGSKAAPQDVQPPKDTGDVGAHGRGSADGAGLPAVSAAQAKKIAIGVAAACLAVFLILQGKSLYADYAIKKEAIRLAEERKQAEEERVAALKAEEERHASEIRQAEAERAAQAAKVASELLAQARKHLGKNGLDMILEPAVHDALREALHSDEDMRALENFLFNAASPAEVDGQIVVTGCSRDQCDTQKAIVAIDAITAKTGAAVKSGDRIFYFGFTESSAPPVVRKWAISLR